MKTAVHETSPHPACKNDVRESHLFKPETGAGHLNIIFICNYAVKPATAAIGCCSPEGSQDSKKADHGHAEAEDLSRSQDSSNKEQRQHLHGTGYCAMKA